MDEKSEDGIKIGRTIFVGFIMFFLGFAFVGISITNISPWIASWMSTLGTGFVAAGILTLTLENAQRIRHNRDVEELRSAHFESILKGVMPEPIFKQIKN